MFFVTFSHIVFYIFEQERYILKFRMLTLTKADLYNTKEAHTLSEHIITF